MSRASGVLLCTLLHVRYIQRLADAEAVASVGSTGLGVNDGPSTGHVEKPGAGLLDFFPGGR